MKENSKRIISSDNFKEKENTNLKTQLNYYQTASKLQEMK